MGENISFDILVLFQKAVEYYTMGDFKKAEKLFGDLINNTSLSIDSSIIETSLYHLGFIYLDYYRNFNEAKFCFEKIIKINPKNAFGYIGLGKLYNFNKQYNDSINILTTAINLDKENFGSYADLATAYRFSNKKEEAIHNFLKAIELAEKYNKIPANKMFIDKNISNLKFNLGNLYFDIKEFDNAIFYLKQVVEENQLDFEVYAIIAQAFLFKKDYKEAEKYANISLNIRENNDAFFVLEEIEKMGNQKIDEYIILLEKEFEKDNNNTELMFKLAESYIHTENFNKAIKLLNILILNNENLSENILRLGFCYYKIQDYDKSIYYYEKALNFENVMVGEIYMMISSSYSNKNDFEPALKYAKLALNTDSTNTEFLLNIGIILYENKKYRDSISYLLKIIKLDNYDIDANIYLSKNYIELLKYDEAEKLLIKLASLKSNKWEVYYLLAKINYKKSNFKTAFDFIEKSLELNPENKKINKLYDDISVKHKTHKKNKFKSNKTNNLKLLIEKAIDYENKYEYDEAIKVLQSILHIYPDFPKAYNFLGIIYAKKCDYIKAIAYFEKSISLNPNDKEVYNNLGNVYKDLIEINFMRNKEKFDENDYKNAINSYLKAIEIDKNYDSPYNGLGMVYKRLNKYQEALQYYKKALELNPNYYGIYNNIANIYRDMNDYKNSLIYYEKALKYNPNSVETLFNMASSYILGDSDNTEKIIEYLEKGVNSAIEQKVIFSDMWLIHLSLVYLYKRKMYDKFIDIIGKFKIIMGLDYKLFILYESIYFLDSFIIDNIDEIHRKKLENIIKTTFTEFFNSNKYKFIHSELYKNAYIWINIKFITFFTFFNIITDEPIKNKTIFEELSKDLDDRNINKILNNPIYNQLENNFIERLLKFKDDNKINLLQQKLLFIEMIQLNFKNTIMEKYEETLDEYKKLYNISEIYLIISTELQEELQKENKNHDEYRKDLMQAVSHTLGNMFCVQKNITEALISSNSLKEDIKRLQIVQTITSSVLDAIKIAFGGNIDKNISFYYENGEKRISLNTLFYFSLTINLEVFLFDSAEWRLRRKKLFSINEENMDYILDKINEIRENPDYKILELSENTISVFEKFYQSDEFNLISSWFSIDVSVLKSVFVEKDSYSFAVIFIIFQELVKNMLKYGSFNSNGEKIFKITSNDNNFIEIIFSNSKDGKKNEKIGTLKGLQMIEMFANVLGKFEKLEKDDNFTIKISIDKKRLINQR